jgi:uncharacterized protein (DUF362 family)
MDQDTGGAPAHNHDGITRHDTPPSTTPRAPEPPPSGPRRVTRRGFLVGAGAGLLVGAPLGWLLLKGWQYLDGRWHSPFTGTSQEVANPVAAMPGPFPGRVIEVRHPTAVTQWMVNATAVGPMVDRGMCELTGADHPQEAWSRFFNSDDVVGIKVNPVVGRPDEHNIRGPVSSPALIVAVIEGLKSAGVRPENIILFERYADQFRDIYAPLMTTRPLDGVRWFASSKTYTNTQLAIDGHDHPGERDPNVIGYDPDVSVRMGFAYVPSVTEAQSQSSSNDERRFYSHLSGIVTRMVNKIVNLPCLKDHRSAGVTLALKNMSHGMNNNVARSHLSGLTHPGDPPCNPNQCNTFIPHAVNQAPLRQKATLHILDGLIGAYEGGPGNWNTDWRTWPRQSLFFATDPVALDRVGWEIIDTKRLLEGWLPVAQMSSFGGPPPHTLSPHQAALAALGGPEAGAVALAEYQDGQREQGGEFDRRQPEHIMLAGTLGLGVADNRQIDHRVHWVGT